jgi:hypothetical protein
MVVMGTLGTGGGCQGVEAAVMWADSPHSAQRLSDGLSQDGAQHIFHPVRLLGADFR